MNILRYPASLLALAALGAEPSALAAPKVILVSLDGASPRFVNQYIANGVLDANEGVARLQNLGFSARQNVTVSPSLTAVGHIAIATGSTAVKNDIIGNSYYLVASPFNANPFAGNISGFGAPIGGYCLDCGPTGGPGMSPSPTAQPIWVSLRNAGRTVVTATWPGGDGIDVRIPGLNPSPVVQPSSERTVNFTVPFGAFAGSGAVGFSLTAADFSAAPAQTVDQLAAAGRISWSPVLQKSTPVETLSNIGGVAFTIHVAALDTTDDGQVNYDTLVFFDAANGIQPGPFSLPSTGPAYVKFSDARSSKFYFEGSSNRAGAAFYVSRLEPDLSVVRFARYSANAIPRNAAVISDVDDINTQVGFWAPQPDFRIPERISPGFGPFPDDELEAMYADQVQTFTEYQTGVALRAIERNPDADLVMVYFEQPDGSFHQFLLTDPRQPSDFLNPNSIGACQDPNKVARYARYRENAYQAANQAVQRLIDAVGTDEDGVPNSNFIVTSDHGFEAFHTAVNMGALLAANGIPTSKVRAVTTGPAVNIYINLQGRAPNGNVTPSEYLILQRQIRNILHGFSDSNPTYTLGGPPVRIFSKIYTRPTPSNLNPSQVGRLTSSSIAQDSGDVFAILRPGYNFDGTQTPVVIRKGDAPSSGTPILSVPNFYGAHGYDPELENLSSIFYAAGPDIGSGVLDRVRNIDIAPTISEILGVPSVATVEGDALPIRR